MAKINILDQQTINQIAAGEVVERPASVAKELVENAIDAGASAITVEIKEGGISLIRVTDNGSGIPYEEIPTAFLRHATSKIHSALDLLTVGSLGFRGEALSSIAAVAQVELLTKTKENFAGSRYIIEGGKEKTMEEAGCPQGTTFLVRNLFYNTPARKKFLKSAATEGGYINELMERMALSRPDISFKYMNHGKVLLHTTGGNSLKDIIYHIYGREITTSVLPVNYPKDEKGISMTGYIGKPVIARGNRTQENYFINGRYIKCAIVGKAIEDAYKSYMMGHKYPFTAIHITVPPEFIDVNVHPSKMELRFADNEAIYHAVYQMIQDGLSGKNMIVPVSLSEREDRKEQKQQILMQQKISVPEPFETRRKELISSEIREAKPVYQSKPSLTTDSMPVKPELKQEAVSKTRQEFVSDTTQKTAPETVQKTEIPSLQLPAAKEHQLEPEPNLLSKENRKEFRLIGQLFATYWLIEMDQAMFIIDQHAAHEKVLFERTMKRLKENQEQITQTLFPPMIVSLTARETDCLKQNLELFSRLGFVIEEFGGQEFKITEVPAYFVSVDSKELLSEVLNTLLSEREYKSSDLILEKVASLSCKAAVKGNHRMSEEEARKLISDMLTLENPYHCPHGRPTTISMSKYELERKFKRIVI